MRASASAAMLCGLIRKRWTAGFGQTCCATRIRPWLKPNRPSPLTEKQSATRLGLAELMVFYCERAAGFCNDLGNQDEAFFDALVRMFEQALKVIGQLPAPDRNVLIARLDRVRLISHNFGYGVGDDMDSLLARHSGT